jgi:hypothetical protein
MSDRQWYKDYQNELKADQEGKPREEVVEDLKQRVEYVFDPNTAPKIPHKWVNRGLRLSCEGAGHPNHQVWLKKPIKGKDMQKLNK